MSDEDPTHTAVVPGPSPPRRRSKRLPVALGGVAVAAALVVGGIALAGGGGSGSPGVARVGSNSSPNGGSHSGSGGSQRDQLLAFSRCMRDHGIQDFPDPDSNGGLALTGTPGGDLDRNNPQFQAAQAACKHLLPNGGQPPSDQDPQRREKRLAYAKCMRDHGIRDFPDPDSNGALSIQAGAGSDLAPDNPQFQTADKACQHLLPGGGSGRQGSTTQTAGRSAR